MTKDRKPLEMPDDVRGMMAQSLEQAKGAFDQYLDLVGKSMSALPWGETDLTKLMRTCAEQNVANAFAFADKMIHAKDFQELVRIQAEFMQSQLATLGEQARNIGSAAAKTTPGALKNPFDPGS